MSKIALKWHLVLTQFPGLCLFVPVFLGNDHLGNLLLSVFASFSELEEFVQALKWVQRCLTDAQSQQDVELVLQLLIREDFRNAYTIHSAVAQQMSRVSPTSPLTAQALGLCQEVHIIQQ